MDAATGHVDVEFQTHFSSEETIQAMKNCEDRCRDNGIIIQEHQFDDGSSFTSESLRDCPTDNGQTSRFSGAGSHHQNGRAERGIRTIMGSARTMLTRVALHWPDAADAMLWEMGVKQAVWIHNHPPPRQTGLSPHNPWSKTKFPLMKLHDIHVFGCPVCALQKKPADGRSTPQWERRSKRGMHVGMSKRHAGSAPLVSNFETGNITAQWNVVFDDWFSTMAANEKDMPDFHAEEWSNTFGASTCEMEESEEFEEPVN